MIIGNLGHFVILKDDCGGFKSRQVAGDIATLMSHHDTPHSVHIDLDVARLNDCGRAFQVVQLYPEVANDFVPERVKCDTGLGG